MLQLINKHGRLLAVPLSFLKRGVRLHSRRGVSLKGRHGNTLNANRLTPSTPGQLCFKKMNMLQLINKHGRLLAVPLSFLKRGVRLHSRRGVSQKGRHGNTLNANRLTPSTPGQLCFIKMNMLQLINKHGRLLAAPLSFLKRGVRLHSRRGVSQKGRHSNTFTAKK